MKTFTLVLIDTDPAHAEDGDFIHVEGITIEDVGSNEAILALTGRLYAAMIADEREEMRLRARDKMEGCRA